MVVSRLLGCLLPLLMAAALAVAPANAREGHAAASAIEISFNGLTGQLQPTVDHSSKWPRVRVSLEEFFELDDDAEQYFKPPPGVHPDLSAGEVLLSPPLSRIYRSDVPSRRPSAAYPTGPPPA
jgi:hypothetical protein